MGTIIKDITKKCDVKWDRHYGLLVMYGNVPLWATLYPELDGCLIRIHQDEETGNYYILGKTPVMGHEEEYDLSTYGDWETLEELEEWLAHPEPLY